MMVHVSIIRGGHLHHDGAFFVSACWYAVRPPLSKGDEQLGSHPQAAGQSPIHPVGRKWRF